MVSLINEIDSYIKELESQKKFNGSVLVAEGDDIMLNKGYGMANYELDIPNTSKTKFCIASITKSITVMSILILVDQGKLRIEDVLTQYIEDFPNGDNVTIYHLITHTSGIFNINEHPQYTTLSNDFNTLEELINKFKYEPFVYEPGSKFKYCNSGYIILAYIIEKVSGMTYDEFINENILEKLSLKDTGSFKREDILKNKASGYSKGQNSIINSKTRNSSIAVGTGNLYSTVEDIYVWCKALIKGDFLKEKFKAMLFTEYVYARQDFYYGLGFMIYKPKNEIEYIYQDGGIHGYRSIYLIDPFRELYIIMLGNYDYIRIIEIARQIRQLIMSR